MSQDNRQSWWDRVKAGVARAGADLAAFNRQGLKEAGQMLVALPDATVRPVEEPGTLGNPVAREVYDQRHPDEHLKKHAGRAAKAAPAKDLDRE